MNKKHVALLTALLSYSGPALGQLVYDYDGKAIVRQKITTLTHTGGAAAAHSTYISTLAAHGNNETIFVQPFKNKVFDAAAGEYNFIADIQAPDEHPFLRETELLYSDGARLYRPKITQEEWRAGQRQVSFFLASYNKNEPLPQGASAVTWTNGLYQLMRVEEDDQKNIRTEKWYRIKRGDATLGKDSTRVQTLVSTPRVPFIPGAALFPIHSEPTLPEEVVDLRRTLDKVHDDLDRIPETKLASERILVMGEARAGKDTLINALAHDTLMVEGVPGIWEFSVGKHAGGTRIVHEVVGSDLPGEWQDPTHGRVMWSTPGMNGVETGVLDIRNAESIRYLVRKKSPLKILLAIPESHLVLEPSYKSLHATLQMLLRMFPNRDELKQCLAVVIMKQNKVVDVAATLKFILQRIRRVGGAAGFSPDELDLLEFLAANPKRLSKFPAPRGAGAYTLPRADKERILESLVTDPVAAGAGMRPVIQPAYKLALKPDSQEFIRKLANRMNGDVTDFLRTTAVQKVLDHCYQAIDANTGTLESLRDKLKKRADALKNARTPEQLAHKLAALMGIKKNAQKKRVFFMNDHIESLQFLHGLLDEATCAVGDWKTAVGTIADMVLDLVAPAKFSLKPGGILESEGPLVGIEDVEAALADPKIVPPSVKDSLTALNLFASNMAVIEKGFSLPGVPVTIMAPRGVVIGKPTLSTTGKKGEPGAAHTQPQADNDKPGAKGNEGKPGGNAGNVYLRIDELINGDSLTIEAKGGKGGAGGDGQKGGDGSPAPDGEAPIVDRYDNTLLMGHGQKGPHTGLEMLPINDDRSRRDRLGEAIKQWIVACRNEQLFYDEIDIYGNIRRYVRTEAEASGKPGKRGGDSGEVGQAGREGIVHVQVRQGKTPQIVQGNNGSGDKGTAGVSGTSGKNSETSDITWWKDCQLRGERTDRPLADRIALCRIKPPSPTLTQAEGAGTQVTTASATAPAAQVNVDATGKALDPTYMQQQDQRYRTAVYLEDAQKTGRAAFLRPFSGL